MAQVCKIYLVRHGESVANAENLCGGDYPLTDKGREQAATLHNDLRAVEFTAVYSSDLQRAVDTAAIITQVPAVAEHQLLELRERDFGPYDGQSNDVWFRFDKEFMAQYRQLPFRERSQHEFAKGVENDARLLTRVQGGLQQIAAAQPGRTVLVVSSAGPMRVLLMDLGFADVITPMELKNTACVILNIADEAITIESVTGYTPEQG